MCRSGVWSSCRLCVLGPLFSSEQRLVSLGPLPEVSLPSLPEAPLHGGSPSPVSPGPPSPFQTVEPKLARLSVAGKAFGSKCEGGGVGWAGGESWWKSGVLWSAATVGNEPA